MPPPSAKLRKSYILLRRFRGEGHEFLHDYVSKPGSTDVRGYSRIYTYYDDFDKPKGRTEFRDEVNPHLNDYGMGFELSGDGEILAREHGYEILLDAKLPVIDPRNVEKLVDEAVRKFRRHNASLADQKESVRVLADVLEFLKPKLKMVLTNKDESDLFNIANNFGIRHHNDRQKTEYDQSIWLRWMFYHYLSTVHVATHLIAKKP